MTPQSAAQVRQFLSTLAGQEWIEETRKSCPREKLGDVSDKAFEVSMYLGQGWRDCLTFMTETSVAQVPQSDFGVPPIDTVTD